MKFLYVFVLAVLLAACSDSDTPLTCSPALELTTSTRNKRSDPCVTFSVFVDNQHDNDASRLSRDALFVADSYLDTQTSLTVFLFTDEGLNEYLGTQSISQEAFLAHPRLDDFIAAAMISETSIVETVETGQTVTLTTQAGNDFTVSNRRDIDAYRRASFDINGQRVTCLEHRHPTPAGLASGSVCLTSRPFVAFDW